MLIEKLNGKVTTETIGLSKKFGLQGFQVTLFKGLGDKVNNIIECEGLVKIASAIRAGKDNDPNLLPLYFGDLREVKQETESINFWHIQIQKDEFRHL